LVAKARRNGQNVAALSTFDGSVSSEFGASWLGLLVGQELVRQEVERQGLQPTRTDRTEGRTLAENAIGGKEVLRSLPAWLRNRMVRRWTSVAILEGRLVANPTPALLDAV